MRGRRLSFDYGDVRIGVAVSDPDAILVTPLEPLLAQSSELESAIIDLIREYEPIYIAVGEPRHLSGTLSSKSKSVGEFLSLIGRVFEGPVKLVDERFTTVSAAARLREAGKNSKNSRHLIDSAAAAEILESALRLEEREG